MLVTQICFHNGIPVCCLTLAVSSNYVLEIHKTIWHALTAAFGAISGALVFKGKMNNSLRANFIFVSKETLL